LEPLRRYRGAVFCLSSAELSIQSRADRFHALQGAIYERLKLRRSGFYLVHEGRLVRCRT
jgi:hypothetical protein